MEGNQSGELTCTASAFPSFAARCSSVEFPVRLCASHAAASRRREMDVACTHGIDLGRAFAASLPNQKEPPEA